MTTRHGYLVIADIAGYTAFLTGTELEHAQGIIEDLCSVIHRALVPALQLVKLEGDALFCLADDARFTDGERLVEVMESCHFDFSTRLEEMHRNTTCKCAACASIGSLGLKFVAHHGEFVEQRIAGHEDVAGPDIVLLHRLLKNTVTDTTGWRAYVLLTEACAARTGVAGNWLSHQEDTQETGIVDCKIRDLGPVTAARRAAHRVYVSEDEADFSLVARLPAPPATVWQYWIDTDKRARWQTNVKITYEPNGSGRMGEGTAGHCDHGSWASDQRFVDWRPFSYYTIERRTTKSSMMAAPPLTETMELLPVDGGTELRYRMRARDAGGRLKMKLAGWMVKRSFMQELALLRQALIDDGVAILSADTSPS